MGNIVDGKCKIKMTGYDALGKSELKGVLTVSVEKMEIMFVKEFDDYC